MLLKSGKFWIGIIFVLAVALFGIARLYYYLTDDFRYANITHQLPHRKDWEVAVSDSEDEWMVAKILQQPFTYIGKGAQSYAFGSADGNYVLKFFKFKHLRPSPWLEPLARFPFFKDYQRGQAARKKRKLEGVFAGYKLAYERHRHESGLILIHLNPTDRFYPVARVVDKLGLSHSIPLDSVPFIVQKRAITAGNAISSLLRKGSVEEAKSKIDAIFALYMAEYGKGIYDNDHGVMRNIGFVEERPLHIDVGKLKADPAILKRWRYSQDLKLVAHRMANWLRRNEPNTYLYFKLYIEALVSDLMGSDFFIDETFTRQKQPI